MSLRKKACGVPSWKEMLTENPLCHLQFLHVFSSDEFYYLEEKISQN
jgi:hypothetical protein